MPQAHALYPADGGAFADSSGQFRCRGGLRWAAFRVLWSRGMQAFPARSPSKSRIPATDLGCQLRWLLRSESWCLWRRARDSNPG